jgi:hypothetical protein
MATGTQASFSVDGKRALITGAGSGTYTFKKIKIKKKNHTTHN